MRDPHEAVDAPRPPGRARFVRRTCRLPRRHGPHERRGSSVRARPRRPRGHVELRRTRPAPRGRHGLHVGCEHYSLGAVGVAATMTPATPSTYFLCSSRTLDAKSKPESSALTASCCVSATSFAYGAVEVTRCLLGRSD